MAQLSNNAAVALAKQLLEKQKPSDIPGVLCRRNFPYELHGPQFDPLWEVLKRVEKGGRIVFEVDPKGCLKIEVDGTCFIHKTDNNMRKLDRIAKETVEKRKVKKLDTVTNQFFYEEVVVVHRPEYERLQENLIDDSLVEKVMAKIREMNAADPAPVPAPKVRPNSPTPEGVIETVAELPAPIYGAKPKGRPRKTPIV